MASQETFWTPRRLIELRVKSRTMRIDQLAFHFKRNPFDIQQAQIYEQNRRRLFIGKRKEIINGKTITITCFAAAWADGARMIHSSFETSHRHN